MDKLTAEEEMAQRA